MMVIENERDYTIKLLILILSTSLFWTCSNSMDSLLEGWNDLPGAIFSGGVPKDGIPAINNPIWDSAADGPPRSAGSPTSRGVYSRS